MGEAITRARVQNGASPHLLCVIVARPLGHLHLLAPPGQRLRGLGARREEGGPAVARGGGEGLRDDRDGGRVCAEELHHALGALHLPRAHTVPAEQPVEGGEDLAGALARGEAARAAAGCLLGSLLRHLAPLGLALGHALVVVPPQRVNRLVGGGGGKRCEGACGIGAVLGRCRPANGAHSHLVVASLRQRGGLTLELALLRRLLLLGLLRLSLRRLLRTAHRLDRLLHRRQPARGQYLRRDGRLPRQAQAQAGGAAGKRLRHCDVRLLVLPARGAVQRSRRRGRGPLRQGRSLRRSCAEVPGLARAARGGQAHPRGDSGGERGRVGKQAHGGVDGGAGVEGTPCGVAVAPRRVGASVQLSARQLARLFARVREGARDVGRGPHAVRLPRQHLPLLGALGRRVDHLRRVQQQAQRGAAVRHTAVAARVHALVRERASKGLGHG